MIAVYHQGRNHDAAKRVIQRIKDTGEAVRPANARHFDPEQLEPADTVYHDGSVPAIPAAYEAAGVPCERWDTEDPQDAPENTDGFSVKQTGSWYKLVNPDGEQVGKSQRSEENAWALMEDADADR